MAVTEAIPLNELPEYWELIEPYLAAWQDKANWSVKSLFADLMQPIATLHVLTDDNGEPEGFLIAQWLDTHAHILISQAFSGHVKSYVRSELAIKEFVREKGYAHYTFTTHRKGWERHAKRRGYLFLNGVYYVECQEWAENPNQKPQNTSEFSRRTQPKT